MLAVASVAPWQCVRLVRGRPPCLPSNFASSLTSPITSLPSDDTSSTSSASSAHPPLPLPLPSCSSCLARSTPLFNKAEVAECLQRVKQASKKVTRTSVMATIKASNAFSSGNGGGGGNTGNGGGGVGVGWGSAVLLDAVMPVSCKSLNRPARSQLLRGLHLDPTNRSAWNLLTSACVASGSEEEEKEGEEEGDDGEDDEEGDGL